MEGMSSKTPFFRNKFCHRCYKVKILTKSRNEDERNLREVKDSLCWLSADAFQRVFSRKPIRRNNGNDDGDDEWEAVKKKWYLLGIIPKPVDH